MTGTLVRNNVNGPGVAPTTPGLVNTCMEVPTMAKRTCSIEGCDRSQRARGWCAMHYKRWCRNGDPLQVQYVQGDDHLRLVGKVDKISSPIGCWLWTAEVTRQGYGQVWHAGRTRRAHRVVYEMARGPIPDGQQLDHLCRVRRCVNPYHLEPVSARVNTLRSEGISSVNARKSRCHRGHPFDDENTYWHNGERGCRECRRVAWREWDARRKAAV